MTTARRLPKRSQVRLPDTWDLSRLFPNDAAWERAFTKWEGEIDRYEPFRDTLGSGAARLAECLKFHFDFERTADRLGNYAFLKTAEDTGQSTYQRMIGRFRNAASRAGQASSFLQPEVLALPASKIRGYLASAELAEYRLVLDRWLRYKPHTLSTPEEKLLAMQAEMAAAAGQIFRQLNDADLRFGTVRDAEGRAVELTHASFSTCLHSPHREVRRRAFHQYYAVYQSHAHTLAAALSGSIQRDIYYARARNYPSSLEAALFPDNVPVAVYDQLIAAVHRHLPALHRYYELRRRKMRLKTLHHYDTYVPILTRFETRHTWNQAVKLVMRSLEPLGDEYCSALEAGLMGRWCDKYENVGKQSGAFSAGSFDGDPYILMNYQPAVLDHVFTLAHEAGHSMHSFHSSRSQPFQYHDYTIFVAEVASTFNEQLLARHLLDRVGSDQERAFLLNREIDAIRGTILRQTMFAEFERLTHESAEANEPLTLDRFQSLYRDLLTRYFGPGFTLDPELSLECFRIPHFYRAFYVYKYATGLAAAIALSDRVLRGAEPERQAYLGFLQGGCSHDPLDLLRAAGVDMSRPEPVEAALSHFDRLVAELEELL